MECQTKIMEQQIESLRNKLKETYKQENKALFDQDIYLLSTELDTLIASYMKTQYL